MRPTRSSMSAPRCAPRTARIHGGCNVENAAYPQGLCAEAGAIAAMVAAGQTRIAGVRRDRARARGHPPCGGCRQRLREFADDDTPVHLCGPDGLHRTVTLGELLPLSLRPASPRRRHDRRSSRRGRRASGPGLRSCWARASARSPTPSRPRAVIPYADLPGFPATDGRAAMPAAWCWAMSGRRRSPSCRAARTTTSAAAPTR